MPATLNEVIDFLKAELSFVEDGGYGRSVRTPQKPTLIFRDSPSCLNFNDPARPHPCYACELMQFVPEQLRGESMPCHHIQLTRDGKTIEDFEDHGSQPALEEAMSDWLRRTIARLEALRTTGIPSHNL
jgi:hypothetical protein